MALAIFKILDIAVKARKIPCQIRFRIRHLTVQTCFLRKLTDPWYQPLRRFRFRFLKMRVLIHRLLQLSQLLIRPCLFHRCRQMIHKTCAAAPLRLDPLSRDRHMVGIDIRQASQSQIRIASSIQPRTFPRKPFQISMRPHMDHGISSPYITDPLIVCQILMRRCDKRIMIDLRRIKAIPARRLHREENMPVHQPRYQNIARLRRHDPARRLSPVLLHLPPRLFGEGSKEITVELLRDLLTRRLLLLRQHRAVIRRLRRQPLHEGLRVLRDEIDLIAGVFHEAEQTAHALDAVQTIRTPDVRILRRVIVKNDRDLLLRIRFPVQSRPCPRPRDHRTHTLGDGQVLHLSILLHMLRSDRHPVNDPIKFRHRDRDGDLHRIHPLRRCLPFLLWSDQRVGLQHRDAHFFQRLDGNRPRRRKGELHHIHDDIDERLSLLHEILLKHLTDRRHPQLRIRQAIREDCDDIQPLPLRLLYECLLVMQVIPDPLIPIEEKPQRRTPRLQESLLIQGKIRHEFLRHPRMIDPCPADRRRRLRIRHPLIKKGTRIEPQILVIRQTPIERVRLHSLDVLCRDPLYALLLCRSRRIHVIRDPFPREKMHTRRPKLRTDRISHETDHDQCAPA